MDPNQQPAPPSGGFNPNQYDFIMNHQQPKRSLFSFGGGLQQKLILATVGLLILLVVIIAASSLFGGNGDTKDRLLNIARQQSQIISAAEIGADKATGTDAKSLAGSVLLSVTTDRNDTLELIKKGGDKVASKDYERKLDTESSEKLTTAEQNGTFDTIFTSMLHEMLQEYQADLETAYNSAAGEQTKATLASAYDGAGLLVKTASTN